MVGQPRRSIRPFLVAVVVAVLLIAGLRLLSQRSGGKATSGSGPAAASGRPCSGPRTAFTLVASSEKAELVKQLAAAYEAARPKVDGACVDVHVATLASGAAMTALARGWDTAVDGDRPDVWSPASSGWVTLLEQRTQAADKPNLVPAGTLPRIAASPLVIAMPRPMAQALGWPGRKLGWSDLVKLVRSPSGWGAFGHPEWGRFKLGKTNPNYSTSGLNATIGTYFAATGRSTDLSANDLANPTVRAFVAGVEQSVVHYGDTTLTFLSNLQRADDAGAGLSYISAVTVEEKSVWDYNQGNPTGDPATLGRHPKPKVPLVAVYPKEGTLLSDHPWVVLNAPWVGDAKRRAAADFLRYLQAGSAQQTFQAFAFRSFNGQAGPKITVQDGLDPREPTTVLSPPGPSVLNGVLTSWNSVRKKANVLLLIDVSGSMGDTVAGTGKSKLDLAKQAAANSLALFDNADRVGLWIFSTELAGNKEYQELVPLGPVGERLGGRPRRAELLERIRGLVPVAGTPLYDTASAGFDFIRRHGAPGTINAVVLLTDGKNENPAGIELGTLLGRLRTEQGDESVRMFTIAYGADADLGVLRQIAQTTNGAAYDSSDPTSIDRVFTAVVSNF